MWTINNFDNILDLDGVLLRVKGHCSSVLLLLVHCLRLNMNQFAMHVQHLEVLLLQSHNYSNSLCTKNKNISKLISAVQFTFPRHCSHDQDYISHIKCTISKNMISRAQAQVGEQTFLEIDIIKNEGDIGYG